MVFLQQCIFVPIFFYPRFRPTSSFVEKIRICDHRSMTDYHRKRLSICAASNLGWRRIGRMDFIIRAAAVSTDYRGLFQLSVWICRGPLTPNLLSVRVSLDSLRTKKKPLVQTEIKHVQHHQTLHFVFVQSTKNRHYYIVVAKRSFSKTCMPL